MAAPTQARFALSLRALGATGLFVALLGLIPLATAFSLNDVEAWKKAWTDFRTDLPVWEFRDGYAATGFLMLLGGGFLVALAVLYLMLNGLGTFAGRRNFAKTNAAFQMLLAVVLLVGINVYSFQHYLRFDCTRDGQFTLPSSVVGELSRLRPDQTTSIIVYQRYKTFSRLSEKPDGNDYAAGRKVVEKVHDLVDEFREFGPQFRVEVLDVESEDFETKYAKLTADSKALRDALEAAPENSIIFYSKTSARGKPVESVQRLGFNEFMQLDKAKSQELSNLVLLPQGVGPFAGKVLAIEERKPRVGFAVIHEYLSSEGPDEYSLAGAKKALQSQGFEVVDFVLKKWGTSAPEPEPAAYTLDESKLEALDEQLAEIDESQKPLQQAQRQLAGAVERFRTAKLEELTAAFREQLGGRPFTEELRRINLDRFQTQLDTIESVLKQNGEARKQIESERDTFGSQERLAEDRRQTDLKAKMVGLLSECDLLFVPRMTLRDVISNDLIRARLYRLDDIQTAAVKEFLKAGKPVLACFGPASEPVDGRRPSPPAGPDSLEELLKQLGIQFGKQTILFDSDSKSFAERRTNLFATGSKNPPPPLLFNPVNGRGAIFAPAEKVGPDAPKSLPANPLSTGMVVLRRNVGGKEFDLGLKHPRPVYYVPAKPGDVGVEAGFLFTDSKAWNEDQPFPTRERTPRFEKPKDDDPAKNTPDEKRRDSFPVGVAVQTQIPTDWYAAGETPATVRVAAIGHGGLFVGPELPPVKEALLLSVSNWLLGRDERLPREAMPWQYPRVQLTARETTFWQLGTMLALPVLFLYLGTVVLLGRRYR